MKVEKYLRLRYIYILSILCCVYYTYIFKVDISFDSITYIDAWSTIREGHIDKWRTPIYPLLLGLIKFIFGDNYLYYVVILQHIVFLLSIRYFFFLTRYCVKNILISFSLTLFYALYPCVATYNCCIATETFAVSGSIFLFYSILYLYKTEKFIYSLYVFIWLLFLIFLRPAVVYLLPVVFMCWCLYLIKRRTILQKSVVYGLTGCLLVSLFLFSYMAMFKRTYGVFTPSGIGVVNKYAIAKAANITVLNTMDQDEYNFNKEGEKIINTIGMDAFSDSLNQSISLNKERYVMRLFQNFRNASESNLFDPSYSKGIIGVISDIMGIKLKTIYFLFFIYGVLLLRFNFFRKELAFFSTMMFLVGLSNFVLIILASPGEYGRLSLPAIPVYLIMAGQLLDMTKTKSFSEIKFV